MTSKKKYLLYLCLFVSLSLNGLVIIFDTIPYALPKIEKRYFPPKTLQISHETTGIKEELLIVNSAITMAKSRRSITVWNEPQGFTQEIVKHLRSKNIDEFRTNNYPQAFLYYGLTEFASKKNNRALLDEIKTSFDTHVNFKAEIKRIDQVPLGLAALNLYEAYGEKKYLSFSGSLYKFIEQQTEEDGLISYRKGQPSVFTDTLGLVVPFLLKYDNHTENDTKLLARKQINYFVKHGISSETFIPSHLVIRSNGIQAGSINWGRGIGWYAIALALIHKETNEFKDEYYGLLQSLEELKNTENLWGQFPGTNDRFDASASTMFIYSKMINDSSLTRNDILKLFKNYISEDGIILETSGDTYAANNYSKTFGKSELSQGLLLLILSEVKESKGIEKK